MTDKQIIIDGVDVSECRYLFDDTSYKRSKKSCSITLKDCKYLGDKCYFKQLKRKEQECEKLKQELDEIENICQIESENNRYSGACVFKKIIEIIGKAKEGE